MKSLSLSRPLILMLIGVPGSGKSFFARQFSETFNAPLVSHDSIRACLFDVPRYGSEEDELIQSLASIQISELLKTRQTLIVDGGLSARADRFALQKMAKENDYGTLTVWVQTDEPTSRFRSTRRNSRRKGDQFNAPLTDEQFDAYARRLTAPIGQEPFVVISGKHTYATQARVVLKKLVAPREEHIRNTPSQLPDSHGTSPQTPPTRHVIVN